MLTPAPVLHKDTNGSSPKCFLVIWSYYTALLNAAEGSIYVNGASQRSAVNYFCITDAAKHI